MGWVGFTIVTAGVFGFGVFIRWDYSGAEIRVGCVDAVKPYDVGSGSRNQRGEFTHQVNRIEDHGSRSVSPSPFELKGHSSVRQSLQVVLRQRGAEDVAGESLHPLAIM